MKLTPFLNTHPSKSLEKRNADLDATHIDIDG